ncbi:MAG: MFS transporter [Acidimicrobiales bacterium]
MTAVLAGDDRALRAIAVQFFVNGVVVASYVPRLPGIRDRLDIDLSTIGTLIAVATLGGLAGSVNVGRAAARFSTRVVMLSGSLALVLLLPLVGFATQAWHLFVILAAIAAADVFTDVAMNMQGSVLSGRRSKPVMNRLHAMWSLGTVVGGIGAAVMAAADVSLRTHLIGASVALAAAVLYVAPGLLVADEPTPPEAKVDVGGGRVKSLVWTFGLLGGAAIVPEMINSDWAAFRFTDDLDTSQGVAVIAYVAFTSGMVAGRLAGDHVVDRLGSASTLRRATVTAAVGIALATFVGSVAVALLGLFVAGVGISVMFPQLYDLAARSERPGSSMGALTAGSRIALVFAPLVVGVVADSDTFTVGAAIALVTVPAALLVLAITP